MALRFTGYFGEIEFLNDCLNSVGVCLTTFKFLKFVHDVEVPEVPMWKFDILIYGKVTHLDLELAIFGRNEAKLQVFLDEIGKNIEVKILKEFG